MLAISRRHRRLWSTTFTLRLLAERSCDALSKRLSEGVPVRLRERLLRRIAHRPAPNPALIDRIETEIDDERDAELNRVAREQAAERVRAERERRRQAALARCAAEGHKEHREVDIIRWDQPEPVRTLRTCPRCGQDVPTPVDA